MRAVWISAPLRVTRDSHQTEVVAGKIGVLQETFADSFELWNQFLESVLGIDVDAILLHDLQSLFGSRNGVFEVEQDVGNLVLTVNVTFDERPTVLERQRQSGF